MLVHDASERPVGQVAKGVRSALAKPLGYRFILYGLGLQVVVVGPNVSARAEELDAYVDRIDNKWAIVQFIAAVDEETRAVHEARTWGQVLTGPYQDAIMAALRETLGAS